MSDQLISVVLPIYNEEQSIPELVERCVATLQALGTYELIFVNDASHDGSLGVLQSLASDNDAVKIIDFSRNFGHQVAISAGIDFAKGDAVVVIDSDLQDPPELIADMVQKWKDGYDVVYGQRRSRKDTIFKKLTAFLFYRTLKRFANIDIPEDTGDFRLMDKRVVDALRHMPEKSRFMRGMTSWVGFRQTSVLFDRDERRFGETAYPLKKMMRLAIDGLTSFSSIPLRLASYVGFVVAIAGFVFGAYAVYRRFFLPDAFTVPGWTTLVIAVFLLGGIQLIMLGVIGEYLGRIYMEVQNRPLYIVKQLVNIEHDEK